MAPNFFLTLQVFSTKERAVIEASNDERVPDANAGALREILSRWSAEMATLVLNEVEVRLRLMAELRGKLDVVGVHEVRELQPLFRRGLWMFGSEFESAEFSSNVGMTRVIRDLLKVPDGSGSRNRPDFVVLPHASIGLYASPSYDGAYEVNGVRRLVIIELKTTGHEIGQAERLQVLTYVKELRKRQCFRPETRIDAFILGGKLDPGEDETIATSASTTVTLMRYDTLLERAERRLLNLYDRIKDAPFLSRAADIGDVESMAAGPLSHAA